MDLESYEVLGVQDASYERDGVTYYGIRLYLKTEELFTRENDTLCQAEGFRTENVWIPQRVLKEVGFIPSVGDRINIFYNKFGKIRHYSPA